MPVLRKHALLRAFAPPTSDNSGLSVLTPPGERRLAGHRDLFVACRLAPPWAFIAGTRLTGLDVLAVEHYAALRGSRVQWRICEHDEIADELRAGRASLAVGGLSDVLRAEPGIRLLRASSRRFSAGEPRHGTPHRHVWALGASTLVDRWSLRVFLLWKRVHAGARGL